jgi:hypothetical protein
VVFIFKVSEANTRLRVKLNPEGKIFMVVINIEWCIMKSGQVEIVQLVK